MKKLDKKELTINITREELLEMMDFASNEEINEISNMLIKMSKEMRELVLEDAKERIIAELTNRISKSIILLDKLYNVLPGNYNQLLIEINDLLKILKEGENNERQN